MCGSVIDVMTREVLVAHPDTSFREVVRLIEAHQVHALPVVDELRQVLGMVAGSDLLVRVERDLLAKEDSTAGRGRTFLQRRRRGRTAVTTAGTTSGEIMTSPAVTIDPSRTLSQAARVLHQRHIGRLPVIDQTGRLIGIVTRSDLLTAFLRPDEDLLVAVQEVIDESPSRTLWATVDDGVVVLQGSAQLLSQLVAIGEGVRRVPGIVHLDVRATAVHDDMHRAMAGL